MNELNFIDIEPAQPTPQTVTSENGLASMDSLASMQIGRGSQAMHADESGIWLGAIKFVDAPFSVDMEGNMTATSLDLSAYLSKAGEGQVLGGSLIINDGTNDRILIGYQAGGF